MFKKVATFFTSIFKGHFAVMKNAFRRNVTLEYPEVRKSVNKRFRGRVAFNYDQNGVSPCTGCGICQRVCPCKDLIKIERKKNESGKFEVTNYQLDISHCIFCGNCVENCPENALRMSDEYELASSNKNDFVIKMKEQ